MTKLMRMEPPEGYRNFRAVFETSTRMLVSRIPSKDLRKRMRKVCKGDLYRSCRVSFNKRKMGADRGVNSQVLC